jgi:hypothetical protein
MSMHQTNKDDGVQPQIASLSTPTIGSTTAIQQKHSHHQGDHELVRYTDSDRRRIRLMLQTMLPNVPPQLIVMMINYLPTKSVSIIAPCVHACCDWMMTARMCVQTYCCSMCTVGSC